MDQLIKAIIDKQSVAVVGLDTAFDYLPEGMRQNVTRASEAAESILEFNLNVINAVKDLAPAVKVQIAYYEMYGVEGMMAFRETVRYARKAGLVVMADAKRNDIGSTAECYAKAFLGKSKINDLTFEPFGADILTVNGYLGVDGIKPFLDVMRDRDKGIFVLVKTSNPSSGQLQNLVLQDGRTVFECMGDLVEEWGSDNIGAYGYSKVGAVVGATHPVEAATLRKRLPHTFFLIPGYGAQGGTADDLAVSFDERGLGGAVNNSRGILLAYRKERYQGQKYYEAARNALTDMQQDIARALRNKGINRIGE